MARGKSTAGRKATPQRRSTSQPKPTRTGKSGTDAGTTANVTATARAQDTRRAGSGPSGAGRQSVAAGRKTAANSNRTQMIIGIVAVSLIAVVVVAGLVMNKIQNAAPVTDHPTSVSSTSTVADGVVTASGSSGAVGGDSAKSALTIDLYEDGLCPACQQFETQFGQQVMKAVDEGKLTVRYHFVNFLDAKSASGDYSTRAAAAFQCVAAVPVTRAPKGLFLNFHTAMFSKGTQPEEGGDTDLSNAQIADIARKKGAPQSAATCITSGERISQAKTTAAASAATLKALAPNGQWGTPSGVKDGKLLNLNDRKWLTNELS